MRLVSYRIGDSRRYGAVVEGGIVDLVSRAGDRWPTLRRALAAADALPALARIVAAAQPDHGLEDLALEPVIPDPDKILCVGLNYRTHATEVARDLPAQPSVFSRLHNTLVPHGGTVVRPRASMCLDFEGELAVIIGRRCRHVAPEAALAVIAGYTCFNDASVRDFQKHSVTAGKNFPSTGALGPWMVTADEIADPQALRLVTRLNGTVVQDDITAHMIYPVAQIITYLSTVTVLEPGDVIATGTPAGVGLGRAPPLWMKPGDIVEVDISGIGTLRNSIVAE